MAWAKKNDVTPPAYVAKAALQESSERICKTASSCSENEPEKSSSSRSCCEQPQDVPQRTGKNLTKTDSKETVYVVGVFAQKCQGLGRYGISAFYAVLPPVQKVVGLNDFPQWGRLMSDLIPECFYEPPEPPPRIVIAITIIS